MEIATLPSVTHNDDIFFSCVSSVSCSLPNTRNDRKARNVFRNLFNSEVVGLINQTPTFLAFLAFILLYIHESSHFYV